MSIKAVTDDEPFVHSYLTMQVSLLIYDTLANLFEGAMKFKHGKIPGNWAICPHPTKAIGTLFGFCLKRRGKDTYSFYYNGWLKFPDNEAGMVTTAIKDRDGKQHGSYSLPKEQALHLQPLIKKAKLLRWEDNVSDIWPEYGEKN